MDQELRTLLDRLDAAIDRSREGESVSDEQRAELTRLVEQVNARLHDDEDHDGLVESLERAVVRFESDHPTLAATIRSAADTLQGYGV